jgi:hypothetical protein
MRSRKRDFDIGSCLSTSRKLAPTALACWRSGSCRGRVLGASQVEFFQMRGHFSASMALIGARSRSCAAEWTLCRVQCPGDLDQGSAVVWGPACATLARCRARRSIGKRSRDDAGSLACSDRERTEASPLRQPKSCNTSRLARLPPGRRTFRPNRHRGLSDDRQPLRAHTKPQGERSHGSPEWPPGSFKVQWHQRAVSVERSTTMALKGGNVQYGL